MLRCVWNGVEEREKKHEGCGGVDLEGGGETTYSVNLHALATACTCELLTWTLTG